MSVETSEDPISDCIMYVPSEAEYKNADGTEIIRFAKIYKLTYQDSSHFTVEEVTELPGEEPDTPVDPEKPTVTESVITIGKANWATDLDPENAESNAQISFNNSTMIGAFGAAATYTGKAQTEDGNEVDLTIMLEAGAVSDDVTTFKLVLKLVETANPFIILKDTVFTVVKETANAPSTLTFMQSYIISYEVGTSRISAAEYGGKKVTSTVSLDGKGNWATALSATETSPWTDMISFVGCAMTGVWSKNAYYTGTAYLYDDQTPINIQLWIAEAEAMADVNTTTIKLAIYVPMQEGERKAVKIHAGTEFSLVTKNSEHADILVFDEDYLIKWEPETSRVTAGKYNNDTIGPVIVFDKLQLLDENGNQITYTAGDEPPMLVVAASDDVDDSVKLVRTWSDGALDANGKLTEGEHTLTFSAVDAAGNEAETVVVEIVVKKGVTPPVDSSSGDSSDVNSGNSSSGSSEAVGCGFAGCGSIAGIGGFGFLGVAAMILLKKKEN